MNCNNCKRQNPEDNKFCTYCGDSLPTDPEEFQSPESSLVKDLQRQVQTLRREVKAIQLLLSDQGAVLPPTAATIDEKVTQDASRKEQQLRLSTDSDESKKSKLLFLTHRIFSIQWEQLLGLNWLAIVGAVALAVGIGFFMRLAFDNNWVGETGRIVVGLATGIILLIVGEFVQRRFPRWAQAVTGGGIGILYLSIYAAFGFFELLDPIPAFLFLALIVTVSGLLALRYESLTIALLAIFGAYLTPILLDNEMQSNSPYISLVYILLVNLGVLGVSTMRNWRWLTLLGLIGSYGLIGSWSREISEEDLLLAQFGVTGIFLIFVGATTLYHILWRRVTKLSDLSLITINAVAFYAITYELLWTEYSIWFGLITLALSVFYGAIGYAATARSGAPPQVALYSLAIALIFLTIAIPLQLDGSWITVTWAAQGSVMIWLGLFIRNWRLRVLGLAVLGIVAFRLIIFDTQIDLNNYRFLMNSRLPTFVFAISAFYASALFYRRRQGNLETWELNISLVLAGVANLLTVWLISIESISYFDSRAIDLSFQQQAMDWETDMVSDKIFVITALWAIYSFGLLGVALTKNSRILRWAGIGLLSVTAIKFIVIDTLLVGFDPNAYTLVLNLYFLAFITVLLSTILAIYLYKNHQLDIIEEEKYVFHALVIVANIVSIVALSAEAIRLFDSLEVTGDRHLESAKHLTLTVLWAAYSIGVIGVGIIRRSSKIRMAGLAMLMVPVLKLFIFDVFQLEQAYRVTAFVALGLLLLATGLAYQWRGKIIKDFLVGDSH